MSVVTRWRQRRAIRGGLLAAARNRLAARKTKANVEVVKTRRDQVDFADRVIARHSTPADPRPDFTRSSPNQSSRHGVKPTIIVLHATEGAFDGAVSWLCNPRADASAHLVISKTGRVARLVPDDAKAWHVAADNPRALGIEQEGYTRQTSWPEAQIDATARWIAYWSRQYGIPITHSTSHGVCRHSDLGSHGGGHSDPGAGYPLDHVLALARKYA